MAHKYDHLREKAICLRTEQGMTLDDLVERLQLPRTTIYHWIKDIPIPFTERQSEAQRKGTAAMQAKYAAEREAAYQQGWNEAPDLLQDLTFRDFVVLYMAEGYKRGRNKLSFVNSDPVMVRLANRWITHLTSHKISYRLQCHIDHDENALKQFWAAVLSIQAEKITTMRKSNSGKLAHRQFRSVHGLLTIEVGDTQLRARLEAWMDYIKNEW